MLFTVEDAFKVKKYYEILLDNAPIILGNPEIITGLFVCEQGESDKVIGDLLCNNFDEKNVFIKVKDDSVKIYEVYAYHDTGSHIAIREIDKIIKETGIIPVYKSDGTISQNLP